MRTPPDFLLDSLQLWLRLVSLLPLEPKVRASRLRRGKGNPYKGSHKGPAGGRFQGTFRGTFSESVEVSSRGGSKEGTSAEDPDTDDTGRERFEQVLRRCWGLLSHGCRGHFMAQATRWLANIMHKNLQNGLEEDSDPGRSLEGRLKDQLTEMTAFMQEGPRAQCGDHRHGALLILMEFERCLNISSGTFGRHNEGRKSQDAATNFYYHVSANHFLRQVPAPSVRQCGELQRWKDALEPLHAARNQSSSSHVSASTQGLFALSDILLCLITSFVMGRFADVACLAPVNRRLNRVAWHADSWSVVPIFGRKSFGAESTARFFDPEPEDRVLHDGVDCLSRRVVGLLLLALRTFSERPMYWHGSEIFKPEFVRLRCLVAAFEVTGLQPLVDFGRENKDFSSMQPRQAVLLSGHSGFDRRFPTFQPLKARKTGTREYCVVHKRAHAAAPDAALARFRL